MSHPKNDGKTTENNNKNNINDEKQDTKSPDGAESVYAVTVSEPSDAGRRSSDASFIRIHSTDRPCQVDSESSLSVDCDVEILSSNKVFPSTSEDSLTERTVGRKLKRINRYSEKGLPSSKSATTSDRTDVGHAVCSDFNITKNTLHVVGSNPGEPKMSYQDPPQKMSKTTKNLLHKVDKRKRESTGRTISYATLRGILKDVRCDPESTGDSSFRGDEEYDYTQSLHYALEYAPHGIKSSDKNVSFDTQVLIFHFTGDLCVGQSVETLSKEKDQQERNSELRKTFMKYNELWPKIGKRK